MKFQRYLGRRDNCDQVRGHGLADTLRRCLVFALPLAGLLGLAAPGGVHADEGGVLATETVSTDQERLALTEVKAAYDAAVQIGTVSAFQVIAESYPESVYARLAESWIAKLRSEQASVSPPSGTQEPGDVFQDCDDCPEMVVIPSGSFMMGSPETEADRWDDEGPQHHVNVRSFALGRYEVTRGEFASFVAATGYHESGSCWVWTGEEWEERTSRSWRDPGFDQTDRDPVVCVNWTDAEAYVSWLRETTGQQYRLASEAEWEYAARAGTTTRYSFGDGITREQANHGNNIGETVPVGSYPGNRFGLYDMHGNVWEWVEDCWNDGYEDAPADGSAWTSGGDCSRRVLRGGSWGNGPGDLRSAFRNRLAAGDRINGCGFRVARTL